MNATATEKPRRAAPLALLLAALCAAGASAQQQSRRRPAARPPASAPVASTSETASRPTQAREAARQQPAQEAAQQPAPEAAQRPAPEAAQTPAPDVSEEAADLSITANVTARELRFDVVPNPTVEFPGRPRRDTVWDAERTNLPRPVQPGVTYRDVGVRLKIVSVFADIDRIVAEALGEVPPSDDAIRTQPPPPPVAAPPPPPRPTTQARSARQRSRRQK